MTRIISVLAVLALALLAPALLARAAFAADRASYHDAELLLAKAVTKMQNDGPDAAFKAFDDKKGGFVVNELYVFVFDMNGKYMASGANPKLVGTDAYDLKDAAGKYLVREMIKVAKDPGKGQVDYVWLNRADNRVENKRSLVHRVGDYIVGVGYYMD